MSITASSLNIPDDESDVDTRLTRSEESTDETPEDNVPCPNDRQEDHSEHGALIPHGTLPPISTVA